MKFPKSRRIKCRSEFARVRTQGKSICGKFIVMGYLKDGTMSEPIRLGLITTKKIGNAVVRNRVRRKLRGILQRSGDSLISGYWVVIVARKSAAEATSEQLEKEWKWMLHKVGMLQPRVAV